MAGIRALVPPLAFLLLFSVTMAITLRIDQTQENVFNAVSDAKDALAKSLGWDKDEIKISNIDTANIQFGQTVVYEFDLQVGDDLLPLRFSEDVTSWQFLDELPLATEKQLPSEGSGLATLEQIQPQAYDAVLSPFQLSGPVELLIQDADQLRLALPNDVEAGVLKKVLLADGAIVTVEGAREVRLERPLQFPLPLLTPSHEGSVAASLLALAKRLKYASVSAKKPLLSLRIVGPTSLVASTQDDSPLEFANKLKVKRLAPGAVELVSRKQTSVPIKETFEGVLAIGEDEKWMWPLPALNATHSRLREFEAVLKKFLGSEVYKKAGSFNLVGARAAAAVFVQVEFHLEKKFLNGSFPHDSWPEWKTKPSGQKLQFELVAKVEGQTLLPVKLQQVEPYETIESVSWRELTGNVSYTKMPQLFIPSSPLTLDPSWEGWLE